MKHQRIYLSPPHMGQFERQYIEEAIESNWIAPVGPHIDAFEREIAEYAGLHGAVALSSGTAAIHLAIKLLGIGKGDLVFCSSLTFVASINPALYEGITPIFIDSEPNTWNMSPTALERAFEDANKIGKLPKAVIIVNLYGQSASMESLVPICELYDVPIIEDAAESIGATYKGKKSGTFGRYGMYSFNGNKIITTSGGGMLISNDTEALKKAKFWASQSADPAPHYQHSEIGFNYRLSNILAGLGRGQLRILEERVVARRAIFERYYNALVHIEGTGFMPEIANGRSTRWLTAMTIDDKCNTKRNKVLQALSDNNIEARPVWKPMHLQPLFKGCKYYPHEQGKSVSDELFDKGICLPSGSSLSIENQDRVIDIIISTIAH